MYYYINVITRIRGVTCTWQTDVLKELKVNPDELHIKTGDAIKWVADYLADLLLSIAALILVMQFLFFLVNFFLGLFA